MSVIRVSETWEGRGGESSGVEDSRAIRTWQIETDNKLDDQFDIFASGRLPQYKAPHPKNFFLTCRSLTIDQEDFSPYIWAAKATYSSEPEDKEEQDRDQQPNPLLRPARVSWHTVYEPEVVEEDVNGNAPTSSAGEYFDPPIERMVGRWVARVSKNVAAVPSWLLEYNEEPINDASFPFRGLTIQENAAKLTNLDISEEQQENSVTFVVLSFELMFHKNRWKYRALDRGLKKLVDGVQVDITDENGKITSPVQLNGSGGVLANPHLGNAVYREFDILEPKDFSVLPLT